jgi:hypothetical protein
MGDLKPIGSEKLQGIEKLNRILEISRYNEHLPKFVNENKSVEYSIKLVNGENYHIIKEKNGYVIKKGINESTNDYIEPMKNRKYYSSYSQAFKRLNLIAKEVNINEGYEKNVSLFNESESEKDEKRFFLKTSTMEQSPVPSPAPAPSPEVPSDEIVPSPEMSADEEIPVDVDMDTETDINLDKEESPEMVTFKTIEKLTGKLAQKIRSFSESEEEPMTSKDIKYVVNSILSALNLDLLDDDDKEEIMSKFEGDNFDEEGSDMGDENMDTEDMGSDDVEPLPPSEPEMSESSRRSKIKHHSYTDTEASKVEEMIESLFSESKVDKILNKYFNPTDSEKKLVSERIEKENKTIKKINLVSETNEQRKTAFDLISRHPKANLIGKTKNDILVFEHNSKKIGVSKSGKLL